MITLQSPIGPFGMMDRMGLGRGSPRRHAGGRRFARPPGNRGRPLPRREFIQRGHLGVASGQGFYSYPNPTFGQWIPSNMTGAAATAPPRVTRAGGRRRADPPDELVPAERTPESIADGNRSPTGFLSNHCCAFHRNAAISSRYAWIYKLAPDSFKWAGMAAIASHHVRLALYPLRFHTDRTGYVQIPQDPRHRRRMLAADVDTIRSTNNAIFDDIFWVHLAYITADDGIERLRDSAPGRPPLRARSSPASRRSTRDVAPWRIARCRETLDGARPINLGRQPRSCWSTSSALWCNPTSIDSPACSPESSRSAP